MNAARLALFTLALAASSTSAAPAGDLRTLAEISQWRKTGRYDEVVRLCGQFQARFPNAVRCEDFGTTPQGRPMKVLVVSTSGALTPESAHQRGLPVVLVQGGIHAGEIDGKDAGLWLLRELLEHKAAPGALDHQVLLFVPVFNVDGHENFRAWNRPNQRGPEEMGFRVTAQRYNLNRDYMKADAPEMQAMLGLVQRWDPTVAMDLHVTDGAKFQHDISITAEPVQSGDPGLRTATRALKQQILDRLATQGSMPIGFYPSFVQDDDPQSGFDENVSTPRFSHGYYVLRNRMGFLVETHSWRTYPERVRATRNTVLDLVELAARDGRSWVAAEREADAAATRLAGTPVPLTWRNTAKVRTIEYRGYAYTRNPSPISGAPMTVYDETRPQIWRVPLRDESEPDVSVTAPRAGYLVPAEWVALIEPRLRVHGIRYERIDHALDRSPLEVFRARSKKFSATSVEGHQRLSLQGDWTRESRELGAGALFVPIGQPKARLLMGLLEPRAPDSLVAWGLMNNAFEQKEGMEAYVAETEAQKMLAAAPALRREFQQRLHDDAAFAKSPQARLDFFYQRHPAWDRDTDLYPVFRTDLAPR